jgi:hypothetical protein
MGSRWRGLRTDLGGEGVILLQYLAAASALQLLHNLGREGGREDMLVKVSPCSILLFVNVSELYFMSSKTVPDWCVLMVKISPLLTTYV